LTGKRYGLHCFSCNGEIFIKGEDYERSSYINKNGKKRSMPICFQCLADYASAENDRFVEEEWYRNNPGKDMEEELRKQYYLNKYGEY